MKDDIVYILRVVLFINGIHSNLYLVKLVKYFGSPITPKKKHFSQEFFLNGFLLGQDATAP